MSRKKLKSHRVKETYFGYDEDSCSVASENSASSLSFDGLSGDEFGDEINENLDRNYRHLSKEHLFLKKAYASLQGKFVDSHVDPQREAQIRTQLEADLWESQSKIEKLETQLNILQKQNPDGQTNDTNTTTDSLEHQLEEVKEQKELLEFRILELEENAEKQLKKFEDEKRELEQKSENEKKELEQTIAVQKYAAEFNQKVENRYKDEVAQLKQQIHSLLEGQGYESELVWKTMDQLKAEQQKYRDLENSLRQIVYKNSPELGPENTEMHPLVKACRVKLNEYENNSSKNSEKMSKLQARLKDAQEELESERTKIQEDNKTAAHCSVSCSTADLHCTSETSMQTSDDNIIEKQTHSNVNTTSVDCDTSDLIVTLEECAQTDELDVEHNDNLEKVQTLETKVIALEKEIEKLNVQLVNKEEEFAQISKEMQAENEDQIENFEATINELKSKIEELQKSEGLLKEINKELEELVSRLQVESENLVSPRNKSVNDSDLSEKIGELEEQVKEQEIMIKTLEETNSVLEASKNELLTHVQELGTSEQELTSRVETLTTRVQELELSENEFKSSARDFKPYDDNLSSRVDELEASEKQLKSRVKELETSKMGLKACIGELEISEESLKSSNRALKKANQELSEKIAVLQSGSQGSLHEVNVEEVPVLGGESHSVEDNSTVDESVQTDETRDSESDTKLQTLKIDLENKDKTINNLQKQLKDFESRTEHQKADVTSLEEELAAVQVELQQEREHSAEAAILKEQVGKLADELNTKHEAQSATNEELQTKIKHLQEELKTKTEINTQLENHLQSFRQEVEGLTASLLAMPKPEPEMTLEPSAFSEEKDGANIDTLTKSQLINRVKELEEMTRYLQRQLHKKVLSSEEWDEIENKHYGSADKPEDILRSRIMDLERMEKHLKRQVADLEQDREELHFLSRKDKSCIHELNVRIQELLLLEKNLKLQINRYEENENKLHARVDSQENKITELEEELQALKLEKESLNKQLKELETSASSLTQQVTFLSGQLEELQQTEAAMMASLDQCKQEKGVLENQADEARKNLQNLEHTNNSMERELKEIERDNGELKQALDKLEKECNEYRERVSDLENRNEKMYIKVRALEEEKSMLKYDISDLEVNKQHMDKELERLKVAEKTLKDQLSLIQRTDAEQKNITQTSQLREMELQQAVNEHERQEEMLKEKIANLEENEVKLRLRIQELSAAASPRLQAEENQWKVIEAQHKPVSDALPAEQDIWKKVEILRSPSGSSVASSLAPPLPSAPPPGQHANDQSMLDESYYLPSTQTGLDGYSSAEEVPDLPEDPPPLVTSSLLGISFKTKQPPKAPPKDVKSFSHSPYTEPKPLTKTPEYAAVQEHFNKMLQQNMQNAQASKNAKPLTVSPKPLSVSPKPSSLSPIGTLGKMSGPCQQCEVLKRRIAELERKLELKQKELDEARKHSPNKDVSDLRQQLENSKQDVRLLEAKVSRKEDDLQTSNKVIRELRNQITQLEEQIHSLEDSSKASKHSSGSRRSADSQQTVIRNKEDEQTAINERMPVSPVPSSESTLSKTPPKDRDQDGGRTSTEPCIHVHVSHHNGTSTTTVERGRHEIERGSGADKQNGGDETSESDRRWNNERTDGAGQKKKKKKRKQDSERLNNITGQGGMGDVLNFGRHPGVRDLQSFSYHSDTSPEQILSMHQYPQQHISDNGFHSQGQLHHPSTIHNTWMPHYSTPRQDMAQHAAGYSQHPPISTLPYNQQPSYNQQPPYNQQPIYNQQPSYNQQPVMYNQRPHGQQHLTSTFNQQPSTIYNQYQSPHVPSPHGNTGISQRPTFEEFLQQAVQAQPPASQALGSGTRLDSAAPRPVQTEANSVIPNDFQGVLRERNRIEGEEPKSGPPAPPTDVTVERILSDDSVLLTWQPPVMDELGRSQGVVVESYKIFVNDRHHTTVSSALKTKALIENLNLSKTVHLSVQTVGRDGQVSKKAKVALDGGVNSRHKTPGRTNSRKSASVRKIGEETKMKRFLAIYDYNPVQQSPNSHPKQELTFMTGDIITTYGKPRTDGFYEAEVNGHRGLVPVDFLEELPSKSSQRAVGQGIPRDLV